MSALRDYRFVFTSGWLKYIILAVVAATACLFLANWQDNRREERDTEIAIIEANYHSPTRPIDEVVADPSAELATTAEWTRVELTGSYRSDAAVLARNRSLSGQPGYYVVVPFTLNTGQTILVSRGWMPVPSESGTASAKSAPQPASGEVTLTGWLRPTQDGSSDDNPEGFIYAIDPGQIPGIAGQDTYTGVYVQLEAENPAGQPGLTPLPQPSLDPGSHLSYTFQWIAFGIMILIAVVIAARRERIQRETQAAMTGNQSVEYYVVDKETLALGVPAGGTRYGHSYRASTGSTQHDSKRLARQNKQRTQKPKRTQEDYEDSFLDQQGL